MFSAALARWKMEDKTCDTIEGRERKSKLQIKNSHRKIKIRGLFCVNNVKNADPVVYRAAWEPHIYRLDG